MRKSLPYWLDGADWGQMSFFLKKLEMKNPLKEAEIPQTTFPQFVFLFLLEGEVLADVDGESFVCRGGQFLLVPENAPLIVHHYKDILAYVGLFSLTFLRDVSYPCLSSGKAILHTFWFDEAAFMAEVMDRMMAAFSRGDDGYLMRALDLILYSIQSPADLTAHPLVSRFMKMIFDRSVPLDGVSGYAEKLGISTSYLNKLVRTQTRHSAMDWVEIARVNWAKSLLREHSVSISEVASAVGVDDPSYFTRFFRKVTGLTPSAFRHELEKSRSWFNPD